MRIFAIQLTVAAVAATAFSPEHAATAGINLEGLHAAADFVAKAKKSAAKKSSSDGKKISNAAKQVQNPSQLSPEFSFKAPQLSNSARPEINAVAISPDGKSVVGAAQDGMVRLWDITSGTNRLTMKDRTLSAVGSNNFQSPARAVAFSPDGQSIASGSYPGLAIFDLQTGTQKNTSFPISMVSAIAFSPSGELIAAGNAGIQFQPNFPGEIKILEASTGNVKLNISGLTDGTYSLAFSPDGTKLVGAGANGEVNLWDASNGQKIGNFDNHATAGNKDFVYSVAFSPDGKYVITGGGTQSPWRGLLKIWNAQSGILVKTIADGQPVTGVTFNHDGTKIAAANWDNSVRIYDAPAFNLLAQTRIFMNGYNNAAPTDGHAMHVRAVTFSMVSKTLVSASSDQTIKGWKF